MVLDAVFPLLTSPTSLLRLLTCGTKSEQPLLLTSSSDVTFFTAKSHESLNSDLSWEKDEAVASETTPNENEATASDSSYRTDRTSSLSTLSESSGATTDDSEEDDGYDEFRKLMETCDTNTANNKSGEACDTNAANNKSEEECDTNSNVANNKSENDLNAEPLKKQETISIELDGAFSPSYYMNFSAMLQDADQEEQPFVLPLIKDQKEDLYFPLTNSPRLLPQLRCMLDILVQSALSLTRDDSANIDNKCPVWKPEGDTKKTLQRMHKWTFDERTKELSNTVLKWTGVLKDKKEELRLIKTRGIVNMTPLDLKNLLIDCSRGHLVNKNSLGKKDVCKFSCDIGTTTIVENTMKVPFVGGEIHSVSLTHSRFVQSDPSLGDDFYVIVSKSVQNELDKPTGLPYYSVSVLRSVADNKTDLVNVAQISEVPVPKFLVNKIAFTGAVDFFTNLRSIM